MHVNGNMQGGPGLRAMDKYPRGILGMPFPHHALFTLIGLCLAPFPHLCENAHHKDIDHEG